MKQNKIWAPWIKKNRKFTGEKQKKLSWNSRTGKYIWTKKIHWIDLTAEWEWQSKE